MYKSLLAASALLLGLALTGTVDAHPPSHVGGHGHVVVGKPYYLEHGVHFAGGYFFRGRDHHHWERCVWDTHYNRYQYFDASLDVWYYWDDGRDCYYPVGY